MENLTAPLLAGLGLPGAPHEKWVSDVGLRTGGGAMAFIFAPFEGGSARNKTQVVVAQADGSSPQLVTDGGPLPPGMRGPWGVGDFDPELSSDGTKVSFQRVTDAGYVSTGDILVEEGQGEGLPLIDFGYRFDRVSNILRIDDQRPASAVPHGDKRRNTQIFAGGEGQGEVVRDYRYDSNGNMTFLDGMTNTWDFKGRLVAVESAEMRAEYRYDYTDRRIWKRVFPENSSQPSTLNPLSSSTPSAATALKATPSLTETMYLEWGAPASIGYYNCSLPGAVPPCGAFWAAACRARNAVGETAGTGEPAKSASLRVTM